MELTIMFQTLILQYLNELVEGEVRDFSSPQSLHTVEVQGLGRDKVKSSAKIGGEFEVPIFALVRDMPEQSDDLMETPPPIAGAFDFTTQCFVKCSEFIQGLFQEVGVLDFLTVAECQVGFHTEVCPNAFICCGQNLFGNIIGDNIEPICSGSITKDLDIAHFTFPIAVVMERKPTFIELKGLRNFVPFFKRDADTSFFKEIARLQLRRPQFATSFVFRTTELRNIEKVFKTTVKIDNHSVKRIPRYPRPMLMGPIQHICQIGLQPITPRIFTIDTVIPILKFEKMVMHIAEIIKHIAETHILRVFAYLVSISATLLFLFSAFFHRFSRLTALSLNQDGLGTDTPCDVLGCVPTVMEIV